MGKHTHEGVRRTVMLKRCSAIAAVLLIAACGTDSVQGAPTTASTEQAAPTVDVSALDVGNYPTTPQPPLGAAGTEFAGKLADARRLADFVVGPWDVDPQLVESYLTLPATVLKSADALSFLASKAVAEAAGRHPFINGFLSSRKSADESILQNAVVRFADDAAASAAATDMADTALAEPVSGATRSRVAVPGHDDALTSTYPFTDPTVGREQSTVRSFTAHGPFVLMQTSQSYQGLDAALGMVAKALDAQKPLIDQFTPTPPADFAGLPLDPSGLLARTILVPAADANVNQNWAYGPRGALHFQTNPVDGAGLLSQAGTDLVASGETAVYRTTDAAAARTLAEATVKQELADQAQPADPVKGLPESKCVQSPALGFYCVVGADRYVVNAQSAQLRGAHQMAAAQYALLVAK